MSLDHLLSLPLELFVLFHYFTQLPNKVCDCWPVFCFKRIARFDNFRQCPFCIGTLGPLWIQIRFFPVFDQLFDMVFLAIVIVGVHSSQQAVLEK